MKHKLLIDPVSFSAKPSDAEVKRINTRIIKGIQELNIDEIGEQVTSPNSKTWIPAFLEGKRNTESWKSQSIFALDFDQGLYAEQVLERLEEYGLGFSLIHPTFSDDHENGKPKFRVIWQLPEVLTHREKRNSVQAALMELFPECDKNCKDPSRIFFGGKNLIYANYDYYLDCSLLIESALFYSSKNSSSSNIKRDISRTKARLNLPKDGRKDGSKNYNTYIDNIESVENTSKSVKVSINQLRGVEFEALRQQIKVLDDFMNPQKKLKHPVLLGLATNLRYIEGGQKLYEKCIKANPQYAQEEKLKIMSYCKSENYPPKSLEDFSPHSSDWDYVNLLHSCKQKKVIRLQQYQGKTVQKMREELKEKFEEILASDDKNIHVIKAPPGIGKTELYSGLKDVLIAVPFHSLKDEIEERLKVPFSKTPSLDNLPDEVKNKLSYYYSLGGDIQASYYLAEMSDKCAVVKQYRDECISCYQSTETVLTTHQKGLFIKWKHETLIFDEDILSTLMPISKTTMNDLVRLESNITNPTDQKTLSSLIDDIRNGRVNTPRSFDLSIFDNLSAIEDEVLEGKAKYESDILHFFDCQYFVVDEYDKATIRYVRKYEIPNDKKIIIMSATADEKLYNYLAGDRLRFYDFSDVELAGLVEQDTRYSFSRQSLLKHVEYAKDKVKDRKVISFGRLKNLLTNPIETMHFGYCSGSNEYEGENIAVVGTPHVNSIAITLYATVLSLPVKNLEFSRVRQQTVHHNGFRFWFNTYDNEYLRSIQFYFIESELRQAIGRARPYTMPSEVLLLSNYPLPESCINPEEVALAREILEKSILEVKCKV